MKPLRQQIVDRIRGLGGEKAEFYEDYSDYDLLEDYENFLRIEIESELKTDDDYSESEE